jgi:hypothetical protein
VGAYSSHFDRLHFVARKGWLAIVRSPAKTAPPAIAVASLGPRNQLSKPGGNQRKIGQARLTGGRGSVDTAKGTRFGGTAGCLHPNQVPNQDTVQARLPQLEALSEIGLG